MESAIAKHSKYSRMKELEESEAIPCLWLFTIFKKSS